MAEQVERDVLLPARPADVWTALTDGEQMSEWFGAEIEIVARLGGAVRFTFPDGRNRGAVIEAFEPKRLLVLRWLPFERDGEGRTHTRPSTHVRFLLKSVDDGTLLHVRESFPDFPQGRSHMGERLERGLLQFRTEVP